MPGSTHAPPRLDLDARLGGPVGRHARRGGLWFNPAPWALLLATLTWLATLLRHRPCQQYQDGKPVDAFLRLCYSDIPLLYQNTLLGRGGMPFRDVPLDRPPLVGVLVLLSRGLATVFGAKPIDQATGQQMVDGAHLFFLTSAVLLFCCFLALVGCALLLGRGSARGLAHSPSGRLRSWDALLVAGAPGILTGALVSWDLLAVALTAAGLLAWALRRQTATGVLLGLAICAGFWPVLVLIGLGMLCLRAGRPSPWLTTAGWAALVWAAVNLPLMLSQPSGWTSFFTAWQRRGPDLGSVWFVLKAAGVQIPMLSTLVLVLMLTWLAWVAHLVRRAPRRPRVGQVVFLLVAGWLLLNKVYSPQQVLWLVLLVPLARPKVSDWAVWSAAEVFYCWAVWGHLGGQLSPGDGSPDVLYWGAIGLRVLVLGWLVAQVRYDVLHPWLDPVRTPLVDDPIGGVLDHAVDRPLGAREGELSLFGHAEEDPDPTVDPEAGGGAATDSADAAGPNDGDWPARPRRGAPE
ncbi:MULTISPECIES: glycosyltransferase family 87 protein [unclassified Luteococcus]|uniref:glycosyltransferase family 87 protein n=1 Tax=unclassified Luteococcus TaxID=2639923 RepID=UPI00313CF921